MNDYKIFAVDFDGTLAENKWPEIGEPIQKMIDYCIRLREQGHKLILWTCRTPEQTKEAVKWCNERGLFFHAVNENLPDEIAKYNNDPRKIGADYFIDDKNLTIEEITKEHAPLTARSVNILGTEYTINKYDYKDKPEFEKSSINGYCDNILKEIAYVDMSTYPCYENETEEYLRLVEKQTLRHEITHAFLSESGLQDSSGGLTDGWATNEEMIDWFAIQSPKIFKVFSELGIL